MAVDPTTTTTVSVTDVLGKTGINPVEQIVKTLAPLFKVMVPMWAPVFMWGLVFAAIAGVGYVIFIRWSQHGVDL